MNNKKEIKTVKTITDKHILRNALIGAIMITSSCFLSGCAKKVDCGIMKEHAHLYKNENYFDRYMVSEKEYVGNLSRTDEYIQVNKKDRDLLYFLEANQLFSIEENKEKIDKIVNKQKDYIEYEYEYYYTTIVSNVPIPMTGYSWTKDKEHDLLTGETRIVHYVYYGYKIKVNEKGKLEKVKSKPVDNLNDLPQEYKYIKEDFYEKIDIEKPKKKLDYEDGPEEDKKSGEKEQKYYEGSKEQKSAFVRVRKINC